jgi:hypothetical protein
MVSINNAVYRSPAPRLLCLHSNFIPIILIRFRHTASRILRNFTAKAPRRESKNSAGSSEWAEPQTFQWLVPSGQSRDVIFFALSRLRGSGFLIFSQLFPAAALWLQLPFTPPFITLHHPSSPFRPLFSPTLFGHRQPALVYVLPSVHNCAAGIGEYRTSGCQMFS